MRRVRPDALAGYVDSSWCVETHTTELLNILRLRRTGWRATTATHRSRRLTAQPQTFTAARMNFGVAQVACNLCREATRGQQYSTLQTSCGCAALVGKQPVPPAAFSPVGFVTGCKQLVTYREPAVLICKCASPSLKRQNGVIVKHDTANHERCYYVIFGNSRKTSLLWFERIDRPLS